MLAEVVLCKNCKHWHTSPSECPMVHSETYDDDGWTEWYDVDSTPDDGLGFCHCGEK